MNTAFESVVDSLVANGSKVSTVGEGRAQAQCPAHDDKTPSLSVTRIEGSVLLHCHGGCDTDHVLDALGLVKRDLFDDARGARYDYTNRTGNVIRTVTRTPEKVFRQSGDTKGQPTLYRLPQVIAAISWGKTIYLCEGEKDVHAFESIGLVATTAPMGATNFAKVDATPLHGAKVVAVVDKDDAGQKWAATVHDKLKGMCQSLTFAQAADGKDAADHIGAGRGVDELVPASGFLAFQQAKADLAAKLAERKADDDVEAELVLNRDVAEELRRLRSRTEARRLFDVEQAGDPAMFDDQYLDADQLDNLPTPDPLISGVLDRHCYAILRGRDGTYKTFIALDWGLCAATGKPWQGKPVHQVRTLYIAGEGAYGINARKKAWEQGWGIKVDPEWFTLRQSAVNLYKGGPALEDLIARVSEGGYGLVIIDTLRRASGAADGNGTDMGVVVDNIMRIIRATRDGSALALAHTDKGDNDTRGFSGIEDDADIVWHAKRDKDRGLLAMNLENVKMKDAPEGLTFDLTMASVLNSLVVSKAADRPTIDETNSTDQTILDTMRDTFNLTGATVKQLIEVTGLSQPTVYRARGRLLNSGHLLVTHRGNSDVLNLPVSAEPVSTETHSAEHDSHVLTQKAALSTDSHPIITGDSQGFSPAAEHDSHPFSPDYQGDSHPIITDPRPFRDGWEGEERENVERGTDETLKSEAQLLIEAPCAMPNCATPVVGGGICSECADLIKAAS